MLAGVYSTRQHKESGQKEPHKKKQGSTTRVGLGVLESRPVLGGSAAELIATRLLSAARPHQYTCSQPPATSLHQAVWAADPSAGTSRQPNPTQYELWSWPELSLKL